MAVNYKVNFKHFHPLKVSLALIDSHLPFTDTVLGHLLPSVSSSEGFLLGLFFT